MKLADVLFESAEKLIASQFKVEEIEGGKIRVRSPSTSGPGVSVIRTMAFFETTGSSDHYESSDDDYSKLAKSCKKLVGKLKAFTLSGAAIKFTDFMKFKAAGIVFSGERKDVEELLDAAVEYQNSALEYEAERKASAPERKKAAAKASREHQKSRLEALYAKYGKSTIGRVKTKQIGGDDGYQWNVIVDGRSIMNGLTKRSADYEQEKAWQRLSKKDKLGTYGGEK